MHWLRGMRWYVRLKCLDFYGADNFKASVREHLNEMGKTELLTVFNDVLQSIYAQEKTRSVDLKLFFRQFAGEIKNSESQTLSARLSVDLKLN